MKHDYVSNGPVSTMPGHRWELVENDGTFGCETDGCESVRASWKIQGETDSFGCEYFFLCQQCEENRQKELQEENENRFTAVSYCEWHRGPGTNVRPTRDIDGEGYSGPLYDVCGACRQKENERIAQELQDEFPEDDDDYEDTGMTQAEIDAQIEAEEEMDRISAEQEAEENNRVKGEEE